MRRRVNGEKAFRRAFHKEFAKPGTEYAAAMTLTLDVQRRILHET